MCFLASIYALVHPQVLPPSKRCQYKATINAGIKGALVSTLKEPGAIIIGISNMQEFGCGTIGSNPHSNYLTPRNPYNTNHYCGGSSCGSASSVAAG